MSKEIAIKFGGDSLLRVRLRNCLGNKYFTHIARCFGVEKCNFGISGTRIAKQVNRSVFLETSG